MGARVRHNLVALGTVAVLAVYSAGYVRTREAAQRFAEEDAAPRRPPPPVSRDAEDSGASRVAGAPADAGGSRLPESRADSVQRVKVGALPSASPPAAPPAPPATHAARTETPATLSPAVDSTIADPPPAALPAPNPDSIAKVRAADSVAKATAKALADSIAKAEKERPVWHDGEYYGWGTSRHGDIQAGIEIKGGRITAAWVNSCLTRYSCSWIAALPPQVVARQSPETDYVTGATQSTNAFYYAVVEALSKAK
jgi:uncharacterized protein with FMN-binding domain